MENFSTIQPNQLQPGSESEPAETPLEMKSNSYAANVMQEDDEDDHAESSESVENIKEGASIKINR